MRKHYLDNLKSIVILLLFPVHALMIWNDYGSKFYIWTGEDRILSSLIIIVNPWIMSLLFVIAGMNAKYSLERRDVKTFAKERVSKLLIPFVSGLLLLIPIQTLYARKFFYNYNDSIFDNYRYFLTTFTDLSGYDGGFSPGHLWFILYLLIISFLSLLIIKFISNIKAVKRLKKMNTISIIFLFVPLWLMSYIASFGVYSLGKYLTLYLIGYYIFSDEKNIDIIIKNKKIILSLFCLSQIILVVLYYKFSYYGDLFVNFVGWMGVLSCLIIGKEYLNKENKLTNYLKKASYPIYILHLPILVIIGYYTLLLIDNTILQIFLIIIGSFITTIIVYEIISRIPIVRRIIGIK